MDRVFQRLDFRGTGWLRRKGWAMPSPFALVLLVTGFGILYPVLWLCGLSTRPGGPFSSRDATNGPANALRWGLGTDVVMLDGAPLQRSLPPVYPDGSRNTFTCDLPSLRYQCALDRDRGCVGYPQLFPSAALFTNWNPEHPVPRPVGIFDSICHFNVSNPKELRLAQVFREMEVPLVVYGVPELVAAGERWTDDYLTHHLHPTSLFKVHVTNHTHYMHYLKSKQMQGERDTYDSRWMTYGQFVHALNEAHALARAGKPHAYYYMMLKKKDFLDHAAFMYDELRFLNPFHAQQDARYGDFFIRDAAAVRERGLRCRLGMQGIIAQGHVDQGVNQIAMIRGTKRYVIAPPSVCKCQGLITTGQSARHSSYNWSAIETLPQEARECPAAEVALTAGEVLYLPSYWYHHIVSLDTSIQCNLRSGFMGRDNVRDFVNECGLAL
ncbi:hypothetical protein PsorP6_016119 [Peronosclerospora sorghi]|uniref:Uncharacterized protein n=1 Tax=Peronosclerospora sorghi TaxID=230839 RepID=A0ACC0VLC8_9STRA|nr:hypothetical protein PsorP6_016119 [Peronosclerospora sorghi]